MASGVLDGHHAKWEERDPLLALALGLLSATRRLDAILDRYAAASPVRVETDGPEAARDAMLCDFMLGAIALRDRMRAALERAAAGSVPVGEVARKDEEELYRDLQTLLR